MVRGKGSTGQAEVAGTHNPLAALARHAAAPAPGTLFLSPRPPLVASVPRLFNRTVRTKVTDTQNPMSSALPQKGRIPDAASTSRTNP